MRNLDTDSGRPFVKVNHPGPGDVVGDPVHEAGYGTGFEAVVDVRILNDDGTELAPSGLQSSEGMGVIGESFGDAGLSREPTTQLGAIEAWGVSARWGPGPVSSGYRRSSTWTSSGGKAERHHAFS